MHIHLRRGLIASDQVAATVFAVEMAELVEQTTGNAVSVWGSVYGMPLGTISWTTQVAGFADASGVFLPLVCTLNAARILTSTAELLGVDMESFAALALAADPGAGGLVMLPYFDGERTPNLPDARGSLHGISRENLTPQNLARAAVEGMLGGLADAVDALVDVGVQPSRVLVVGGAASNPAVADVAATLVNVPVQIPPAGEYVADGAARQAAWILRGGEQPAWSDVRPGETVSRDPQPVAQVREQYRQAREALYA